MSLRKWNDSKGYHRGAKGINDDLGQDFTKKHNSAEANKAAFGRSWDFTVPGQTAEYNGDIGSKDGETPDYDH